MLCSGCSVDFPSLTGDAICGMCRGFPGLSEEEKTQRRTIPQCRYCGLVYPQLVTPLCNKCSTALGPILALSSSATPTIASSVLQVASGYKQKASDTRLGLAAGLNANLAAASKAKAIALERAAAKKAHESQTNIRIDAVLYKFTCKERFAEIRSKRDVVLDRLNSMIFGRVSAHLIQNELLSLHGR